MTGCATVKRQGVTISRAWLSVYRYIYVSVKITRQQSVTRKVKTPLLCYLSKTQVNVFKTVIDY